MKVIILIISVISMVTGQGPYMPSGWRPRGPAFELPQRNYGPPTSSRYLPPLEPRNPDIDDGLSVQGLPEAGVNPLFQITPQKQYGAPDFSIQNDQAIQEQYFTPEFKNNKNTELNTDEVDNDNQFNVDKNSGYNINNNNRYNYPPELLLQPLTQLALDRNKKLESSVFNGPAELANLQRILNPESEYFLRNREALIVNPNPNYNTQNDGIQIRGSNPDSGYLILSNQDNGQFVGVYQGNSEEQGLNNERNFEGRIQNGGFEANDLNRGTSVTAVASAFGTRLTPRLSNQYGSPFPRSQTTTENDDIEVTTPNEFRNSKLRTRRIRPVS